MTSHSFVYPFEVSVKQNEASKGHTRTIHSYSSKFWKLQTPTVKQNHDHLIFSVLFVMIPAAVFTHLAAQRAKRSVVPLPVFGSGASRFLLIQLSSFRNQQQADGHRSHRRHFIQSADTL